jgi:hypothetical protein
MGSPRFLESPRVRATFLRPRWDRLVLGHSGRRPTLDLAMLPSAETTASAPTTFRLSGLNHAARTLAVYASSPGSSSVATQDSLTGGDHLPVRDSNPQGSIVKFQRRPLHRRILLTQAWPGAPFAREIRSHPTCQAPQRLTSLMATYGPREKSSHSGGLTTSQVGTTPVRRCGALQVALEP